MRSWNHAEWAGVWAVVVEMQPDGEEAIEEPVRRAAVVLAVLDRPRAKAFVLDAIAYGDGGVLMPRDEPVRGRGLVEKDGTDGDGIRLAE